MKYVANTQGMPDAVSKNFRDIERAMKQLSGSTSVRSGEQQTPSPVTIPIFDKKASSVTVDPFGDIVAVTVQTALQELDTEKQPLIAAGTTLQYWRGDKTWQALNTAAVVESTNLYFTNLRAQSAITGGASSIVTSNLTASRALASDASGKVSVATTTLAEINFLSGLSSNAQTQLNGKVSTSLLGAANGVATLGADTKIPLSQIPVIPITNGGTGSSTQNFVDLSATQTANGQKTWGGTQIHSGVTILQGSVRGQGYTRIGSFSYLEEIVGADGNIAAVRLRANSHDTALELQAQEGETTLQSFNRTTSSYGNIAIRAEAVSMPRQVRTSSFTLPTGAPIGTIYFVPSVRAVGNMTVTAPSGEGFAIAPGSLVSTYTPQNYTGTWVAKVTSTAWDVT